VLDVLRAARERLCDPVAARDCAIATIVDTEGSVPRPVGTSMLVDDAGAVHGSLSGGCVEGAVLEACLDAISTGRATVHRFGYSEADAFAVGLMCGGSVEVLVQPFAAGGGATSCSPSAEPAAVVLRLPPHPGEGERPGDDERADASPVSVVEDDESIEHAVAPLVPAEVRSGATQQVERMVRAGTTGTIRLAVPDGRTAPIELFVESRVRPAHLVVLGANAFGAALVEAARPLGFRITLCDPRPAFTDPVAFPGAEVVRAWPHEFLTAAADAGDLDARAMICVLTHDPKVDVPALICALGLDVAYVGAMGSRRSDRDRRSALRTAGVDERALARLHSPIGLDLDAATPGEIAVAVLAEILAVRAHRHPVTSLSEGSGPLHGRPGPTPPTPAPLCPSPLCPAPLSPAP